MLQLPDGYLEDTLYVDIVFEVMEKQGYGKDNEERRQYRSQGGNDASRIPRRR